MDFDEEEVEGGSLYVGGGQGCQTEETEGEEDAQEEVD